MEIELVKKEHEEKKLKFEELEVGTVIEVDDFKAIVMHNHQLLLINHWRGNSSWLSLAESSLLLAKAGNFKVIGKATKLIVEEI